MTQPERPHKKTSFEKIKAVFLQPNPPHQSAPGFPRFLDLPQETIDMILDMAIADELPEDAIRIRLKSMYAQQSLRPSFSSALDPFLDFPFILPTVPAVFQLNHAIRTGLLRRHARDIVKFAVRLYHQPVVNKMLFIPPVRPSSFYIALFMRYISPQQIVEKGLKISSRGRTPRCAPAFKHIWHLEVRFIDKTKRGMRSPLVLHQDSYKRVGRFG